MASRITSTTDGMWVRPRGSVLSNAGPTTAPFVSTDTVEAGPAAGGAVQVETASLTMTIFPVETIADTQTLATGIPGILAVAWQANNIDADRGSVFVSDVATGELTFSENESGTIEGWVWILHRG